MTGNNLFDNSIETPKEQFSTRLSEFLKSNLLVGIPARVVNVDNYENQQVVNVKPVLDDLLIDDRELKSPTINSVFVKLPAGGGFAVKLPIAVGDLVTLHYSHKDISTWLDGDGADLAQSTSKIAQKRDCWVTHGFGTRKSNQAPSASDYVTEGPNTTITITPDGQVTLDTKAPILLKTTSTTTIDSNLIVTGSVTAPSGNFSTSLVVNSKELDGHTHNFTNADNIPDVTEGNN